MAQQQQQQQYQQQYQQEQYQQQQYQQQYQQEQYQQQQYQQQYQQQQQQYPRGGGEEKVELEKQLMDAQRRLADVRAKTDRDRVHLEAEKNNNRRLEVIETLYGGLRQKMKKTSKWPGAAAVVASGGDAKDAGDNDGSEYAEIKTPTDEADGAAASVKAGKPTKTAAPRTVVVAETGKASKQQQQNIAPAPTNIKSSNNNSSSNHKPLAKPANQPVAAAKTSSSQNSGPNQQPQQQQPQQQQQQQPQLQQPNIYIVQALPAQQQQPQLQQPSPVYHQMTSQPAIIEPTLYAPLPVAHIVPAQMPAPAAYVTPVTPAAKAVNQPVLATPIATQQATPIVTYPHHVYYASQSASAAVAAPAAVPVPQAQAQIQVIQPQVAISTPAALPLATMATADHYAAPYSLYLGRSLPVASQPPSTTYVPVTPVPTTNYIGLRY